MMRSMTFAVAGAIAVLALTDSQAAERPIPQIAVTGQGESFIEPDMAVLSLTVTSQEETARAALDANNRTMNSVFDALRAAGIVDRDMQTSNFSIQPRFVYPKNASENRPPRIVGYDVSNSLTVRVRDLAELGKIIDLSVTMGVNQGGNITFTNDDPSQAITEARTDAMKDAIARARTLAEAAGVELGDILTISEQASTPRPLPVARAEMAMRAADAVPIAAGENSYRVQVNVTFEIEQ